MNPDIETKWEGLTAPKKSDLPESLIEQIELILDVAWECQQATGMDVFRSSAVRRPQTEGQACVGFFVGDEFRYDILPRFVDNVWNYEVQTGVFRSLCKDPQEALSVVASYLLKARYKGWRNGTLYRSAKYRASSWENHGNTND